MKVALGADHGGFLLKEEVKKHLIDKGYEVKDFGTYSENSTDYNEFGIAVAEAVSKKEFERGILVCGTGIGMSIMANKVPGIRAALVHDFLYHTQTRTRAESDGIFKEAMKVLGVNWFVRGTMFNSVRAFGFIPWNKRAKELKQQKEKV